MLVAGRSGKRYLKSGFDAIDFANFSEISHLLLSSDTIDNSRNLSSYVRLLQLPNIRSVARFWIFSRSFIFDFDSEEFQTGAATSKACPTNSL